MPVYLLVFTELGCEKRFSATIARRLANMGALTKGDRRAERAGNLDKYNLESKEGRAALNVVYQNYERGFNFRSGKPETNSRRYWTTQENRKRRKRNLGNREN
jgi:hypothetical protein